MRRRRPEDDVPLDTGVASSRDEGGEPNPRHPDQHTTTGTTRNEEFVGRVSGEDAGYAGETGAEARSQQESGAGNGGDSRRRRPPRTAKGDER